MIFSALRTGGSTMRRCRIAILSRCFLAAAFFLVLAPFAALAQEDLPFTGLSCFAGMSPRFPVERVLAAYPADARKPAIALLHGTFGRSTRLISAFISRFSDRPHMIELHFSNETARIGRGRPYPSDLLPRTDIKTYDRGLARGDAAVMRAVRRHAAKIRKRYEPLVMQNPNTVFVLSTGLESMLSGAAHRRLADAIRGKWPVPLARAPFRLPGCARAGADLREIHRILPRQSECQSATIFNTDGTSVDTGDGESWNQRISLADAERFMERQRGAFAVFLWSASLQGLRHEQSGGRGEHTLPSERKFTLSDHAAAAFRSLLARYQAR